MLSRTTLTALRSATRAPAAFPSLASSSSSTPLRPFSSSLARPSDNLTDGEKLLKDRLEQGLEGAKVQVQDVSGAPLLLLPPSASLSELIDPPPPPTSTGFTGGCGSFYAISVEHSSFKGLSMIKQHRVVNELLKDEIKDMHGLQVRTPLSALRCQRYLTSLLDAVQLKTKAA